MATKDVNKHAFAWGGLATAKPIMQVAMFPETAATTLAAADKKVEVGVKLVDLKKGFAGLELTTPSASTKELTKLEAGSAALYASAIAIATVSATLF